MSTFRSLRYRLHAFLPHLLDIQHEKFREFITVGIARSLQTINPIQIRGRNLRIVLYPESFLLVPPTLTPREALLQNKAYDAALYVPVHKFDGNQPLESPQWALLGNVPMMTPNGHFIMNGAARVIVNQVIRRPGLYFKETIQGEGHDETRVIFCDFICRRGAWVRLQLDKKGRFWVCLKRTPKLNLDDVITAFEIVEARLQSSSSSPFSASALKTLERLQERLRLSGQPGDSVYRFFYNRFKNPRVYDLGVFARHSINRKLNLSEQSLQLTAADLRGAKEYMLDIYKNIKVVDDIDNLANRRVRPAGDLLEAQLDSGLSRLEKVVRQRLDLMKQDRPAWVLFEPKQVNQAFREFFGSSPLSQFLDQLNPLGDVTHKRRINSTGPGGVSRDNATLDMRNIHATHYGRICPIETPEGKNAGLVNSLTVFGHVTNDGYIETPYYRVCQGQIQHRQGPFYFSTPQEQSRAVRIAPPDLNRDAAQVLPPLELPARVARAVQEDFVRVPRMDIDYITIASPQLFSIATSLIPFLEHDDANRALMGSNMQRQTVPVMRPERPIVGTGLEGLVVGESGHIVQAARAGVVSYVSGHTIVVQSPTRAVAPAMPLLSTAADSTCPGFFLAETSHMTQMPLAARDPNKVRPRWPRALHVTSETSSHAHMLHAYDRSNQETAFVHRPSVNEGDWVQRGDLLADCAASVHGSLALGHNLLVAYVPWEGYNFEDAVVISERLVFDEVYTTIHIEKYETETGPMEFITRESQASGPQLSRRAKAMLDDLGIVRVGQWVKTRDILVRKLGPFKRVLTPWQRLVFDIDRRELPKTSDASLRVPHGVRGRVVNTLIVKSGISDGSLPQKVGQKVASVRQKSAGVGAHQATSVRTIIPHKVRVFIAEKRPIQVGDKVAGRHGNKGIISCILPRQDMPYLPDGSAVDMVLNPLGVPSRMNVGQVFECLLGLAGSYLGQEFRVTPFDELFGAEASRSLVYLKLYQARLKTKQKWLFHPSFPGKTRVFDGRTGEPFDQFVTVGRAYMLKLVHLVEEKIHARATGGYNVITQQPIGGRSRNGGQRLGEMEVWALQAYGAAYALQELLTSKSDDLEGRATLLDSILAPTLARKPSTRDDRDELDGTLPPREYPLRPLPPPPSLDARFSLGTSEAFRVLLLELQSLCLDVGVYALTASEPSYPKIHDMVAHSKIDLYKLQGNRSLA